MKTVYSHYRNGSWCLVLMLMIGCIRQQPPLSTSAQATQPTAAPVVPGPLPAATLPTPPTKTIAPKQSTILPAKETATPLPSIKEHRQIPKLNFDIENRTGKTVYVACFAYSRRHVKGRWHWLKSPVYTIKNNGSVTADIPRVSYEPDNKSVYGALGIFSKKEAAEDAIYELLDDAHKIDLDLLYKLKGKKVTLNVEHYGFKKPLLEFDFVDEQKINHHIPELDFYVRNTTDRSLLVCGFIYHKRAKGSWIKKGQKDDIESWRFSKTKVLTLKPEEVGYIDVETIQSDYDRASTIGYVAVFELNEKQKAEESTFELLEQKRILSIGNLQEHRNGLVNIEIKKYGILEDVIEYTTKPIKQIDMEKLIR